MPVKRSPHLRRLMVPLVVAAGIVAVLATGPAGAQADSSAAPAGTGEMSALDAVILGLIEGITEFLPVSSTGHLTVAQDLLGIGTESPEGKEAADAYAVVIQAGAILAIAVLYRRRLMSFASGLIGHDDAGRRVLIGTAIAVVPLALVGLALESRIKEHLFGVGPVIVAWVVGGVVLLVLSRSGWWAAERAGRPLEQITVTDALVIGAVQSLALWPGTSRSLVTIVAALAVGLSIGAAVEFSFLVGLVTLGAATLVDGAKHGGAIVDTFGWVNPVIGFVVAFASAVVAVRWMVEYLQRHSLAIFGWYRLGVAALAGALVWAGVV